MSIIFPVTFQGLHKSYASR